MGKALGEGTPPEHLSRLCLYQSMLLFKFPGLYGLISDLKKVYLMSVKVYQGLVLIFLTQFLLNPAG